MDKFVISIKKKYKERLINREKQWPPCHLDKLVRLEFVETGQGDSVNQQRGGKYRGDKQTLLAYSDLFKVDSGKRPVRKILIEGDAGIGKTTFCTSASKDWAEGKLFQEFDIVLLLPLRYNEVASAGSLPALLELLHSSSTVRDSVASYLYEEEGEKVLIVADGWDELSESERQEESFLYKLFFKLFPFISVILTSRPSVSAPLYRLPCIDRFVEVRGFSNEDIKDYILSEFVNDQEKAGRLVRQLESNPLVESVCSVPLNCAIVCHLWRTLEEAIPVTMSNLYTKIILNVILRNIQKIEKFKCIEGLTNFDSLPVGLQHSWLILCRFAFLAKEKDQIVFSRQELAEFFPQGLDFDENVLCFGLLQCTESVFETGRKIAFHFLHLTFQEYLAALYLARQPIDKVQEFFYLRYSGGKLPVHKGDKYSTVWRFYFGIAKSESTNFGENLITLCMKGNNILYVRDVEDGKETFSCLVGGNACSILCQFAFEATNQSITDAVFKLLHNRGFTLSLSRLSLFYHLYTSLMFDNPRSAFDCAAMVYVIACMQECADMAISFYNAGVSEIQISALADVLSRKHGKVQVTYLSLSHNKLTDQSVTDLFCRASIAFHSLKVLHLGRNRIGTTCMEAIKTALEESHSKGLIILDLFENPLGVSGIQILEDMICNGALANLIELNLQGCLTSVAGTKGMDVVGSLLEALSVHCLHLNILNISNNIIQVDSAAISALVKIVSRNKQLQLKQHYVERKYYGFRIYLNELNFDDNGLSAFTDGLMKLEGSYRVHRLEFKGNNIQTFGLSCLNRAISSNKIVDINTICLDDNPLGLQGVEAIGTMLSSCQSFIELSLSGCQLTTRTLSVAKDSLPRTPPDNVMNPDDNGVTGKRVGQQLWQLPYVGPGIKQLNLNYNNFTEHGVHILAGFMHLCPYVDRLYCNHCGITSNDLRSLHTILTSKWSTPNHSLVRWSLRSNEIDDIGIDALSECLQLFPSLGYIDIHTNPVSEEAMMRLQEEVQKRKYRKVCCLKEVAT